MVKPVGLGFEPIDKLMSLAPGFTRVAELLAAAEAEGRARTVSPAVKDDEYRPASWFKKGASTWLRKAAAPDRITKRVAKRMKDGVVLYSVADVKQWRPDLLPPMPEA